MGDDTEILKHDPDDTLVRKSARIRVEEGLIFEGLPMVIDKMIHDLREGFDGEVKTFTLTAGWDNEYLGSNVKTFQVFASMMGTEKEPGMHTREELEALMREARSTRSYEDLAFYEKELAQLDKEGK